MKNINRVILTGNLTRSPKLTELPSGTVKCDFSIAVNSREKVNDEWQDHVDFFDVRCFGQQAEAVGAHLGKGSPVAVEGRLRHERWEKDGQKRSMVRVIAGAVQFLPDGRDRSGGQDLQAPDDEAPI